MTAPGRLESGERAHRLAGRAVLVTGATGFLGSHLCRRLRGCGAEVHGVSRRPPSAQDGGWHWCDGDMADMSDARRILRGIRPQFVFHLAGHARGGRARDLVLPTLHSNLVTTVNLLMEATEVGCERIVIVASMEEPRPDEVAPVPSSPYAASKWAATVYSRMFHELYHAPVVIARVFMTYGPGQRETFKLIPHVILSLLKDQSPELSSGDRAIDWIYQDDVMDGLIAAAEAPAVEGCIMDLGSGALVSIHDLVRRLETLVGSSASPVFGALTDRPREQVRAANIAYTFEKIGWQPKTALDQGLAQTVDWYRAHLQTFETAGPNAS